MYITQCNFKYIYFIGDIKRRMATISRPMMLRPFPIMIKSKISGILANKDAPSEVLIRMLSKFRGWLQNNPFRLDNNGGILEEKDIEEIEEECFLAELLIGLETRDAAFQALKGVIKMIEDRYMGALLIRNRLLGGGDIGDLDKLGSNEKFIISSMIMAKN